MKRIVQILAIGSILVVVINGYSLNGQVAKIASVQDNNNKEVVDDKIIHLSTSGNNVIVFVLDRAISGYIPFIFDEKSEISEAFEGFTYYPNTLSFGAYTIFGSPAIFGGYEYSPVEMNNRSDETLMDKHDEALRILPKMFSDEGYQVTVCSPPLAGYCWTPDLSIYDGMENVNAYDTVGWYTDEVLNGIYTSSDYMKFQQSSFFYYSIMKICPLIVQTYIYNGGEYRIQQKSVQIDSNFLDSYTTLTHLSEMTLIEDDDSDNVLIMQNSTTHDVTLLKTPEYEPEAGISTSNFLNEEIEPSVRYINGVSMELSNANQTAHYQSNVSSLAQLAKWFEYLKENNCWDNTRIIVVSDHGRDIGQFDYMKFSNGIDVESYNSLLLVKDFGATEYKVSDEFMTNADVPTLAVEGLIDNPTNPYTGKLISSDAKADTLYVTTGAKYWILDEDRNVFDTSDGEWYVVGDNIFDENNWLKVED